MTFRNSKAPTTARIIRQVESYNHRSRVRLHGLTHVLFITTIASLLVLQWYSSRPLVTGTTGTTEQSPPEVSQFH
jgi:hypothetical protein